MKGAIWVGRIEKRSSQAVRTVLVSPDREAEEISKKTQNGGWVEEGADHQRENERIGRAKRAKLSVVRLLDWTASNQERESRPRKGRRGGRKYLEPLGSQKLAIRATWVLEKKRKKPTGSRGGKDPRRYICGTESKQKIDW